jgi:hypothetical protein
MLALFASDFSETLAVDVLTNAADSWRILKLGCAEFETPLNSLSRYGAIRSGLRGITWSHQLRPHRFHRFHHFRWDASLRRIKL